MGCSTMTKLAKIMKDKDISTATKTKLVYFLVFPVVTYGSESWILRKADQRRLNAFEMWTWRRILRIPWTAKKTNDWVLEQIQPHMPLLNIIERGKLQYCGYILKTGNSLENVITQGKVEGKRRRGRPRRR